MAADLGGANCGLSSEEAWGLLGKGSCLIGPLDAQEGLGNDHWLSCLTEVSATEMEEDLVWGGDGVGELPLGPGPTEGLFPGLSRTQGSPL